MPKVNSIQTSFHGGEFSPLLYGQVHADRFKTGLQVCLNYLPTLQGPLIRRPGTKYVNNVKDSANPPALIPFIFSQTQAYALEFGSSYVRFYTDNGRIITTSSVYSVTGLLSVGCVIGGVDLLSAQNTFYAARTDYFHHAAEGNIASSVIPIGSALELKTIYSGADVGGLKFSQKDDTIYITHPNYPPAKIQRAGQYDWSFKPLLFQDGPYLPLNSYKTVGDKARVNLIYSDTFAPTITTGPTFSIFGAANNGAGLIRIQTSAAHGYQDGDRVFIEGVPGTTEANNSSSSIATSFWRVTTWDTTHLDLQGSHFVNTITGSSGKISPALFEIYSGSSASFPTYSDASPGTSRVFAVIGQDGFRYWGIINTVVHPAKATGLFVTHPTINTTALFWQMGVYSLGNGFPATSCFHQDRLVFAGCRNYPQQIDMSMTGDYENFASRGSSLQVTDNNAVQFRLLSDQNNPIMWIKSAAQGLLAGSQSAEWQISPNTLSAGITPTNITATPTSYFGSADADAVQAGNATLYVQRAFRKIREMNFFYQVGTFRSTDLTEIAEHITIPRITKLTVQKETVPLVWGLRSDGNLITMSYSRDDITLKAGWSRHRLGGQSDSAGTNPIVKSFCAIPTTSGSSNYDQVWMAVQRSTMSGSTYTSIEYTTKPYDDSILQEDAFQADCGATYDAPLNIATISNSSNFTFITSPVSGLVQGDQVQITDVIGLNSSTTDALGNITEFNLVNEKTFIVGSAGIIGFYILDFNGTQISPVSYGAYVAGGHVRKMVKTITGLNWLAGETVGILTDGGLHPDVVVSGSGSITLNYRAAKVQIGYRFNSDGQSLRQDGGSAQGTAIGETSRMHRVAAMFHNMGDFAMGQTFTDLVPVKFQQASQNQTDLATPLFSGIERDATGAGYDFDGWVCWRQSSMLPGMLNALVYFQEVQDV